MSCNRTDKQAAQGKPSKQIQVGDLEGNWYLNKWTTYHTLIISDSTIFVDNNIDTVFTLNYSVSDDTLKTWPTETNRIFKNKILKLTNENLIVDGIADIKELRTYSRKRTEFKND